MANAKSIRRYTPYFFLLPCLLLLGALLLFPLVSGIYSSFFNTDAFRAKGQFIGLENYLQLFRNKTFLVALRNTLWFTIAVLIGRYFLGLLLATLLNQKVRGRLLFRAAILIPWVIPPAIAAIVWKWIYSESYGILNYALTSLGLIDRNVAWLAYSNSAMWAIIAVGVWEGIPFIAIVLLAVMQSISGEEYEAAMMDGANPWQRFRYITMPHLKGISFTVIILTTIWNINQFETTFILTRGGPGNSTQVLSTLTYDLYFSVFQFSSAAAVAAIMFIMMMVLTGFYIKRIL